MAATPMADPLSEYLTLTRKLFEDRQAAPRGELSWDEESDRADALDALWWTMTGAERAKAEEAIEELKKEFE
jgi:hypothetical protein